MTAVATLRPAARRLVRSVAGRRALQVVLFLGGLLALGLIGSAQAHAAETAREVPGESRLLEAEPQPAAEEGMAAVAEAVEPIREAAQAVTASAASSPADMADMADMADTGRLADPAPVVDSVSDPVAAVRAVGRAGTEPVRETLQPVRDTLQPVRETLRPVVRSVGAVAGEAVHRVKSASASQGDAVAPERGAPHPASAQDAEQQGAEAVAKAPKKDPGKGPGKDPNAKDAASPRKAGPTPTPTYSPLERRIDGTTTAHEGRTAVSAAHLGVGGAPWRSPLPQPFGVAAHAVADSGTKRYGDPLAAALFGGTSHQLVSGPGAQETYAPVRDRQREILEFPG
ncbi:hypothetical protein U9R90_13085 [Streptomyces sp. E11-3]|uniref:hypothetical protein n=1 Tax=Streptomyces sp. E11-3 TaxID=3110112 RepID=UPI00398170ED